MRIELGYPDRAAERTLLQGADRRDMIAGLDACLAPGDLMDLQAMVKTSRAAPLLDYIQALVEHSRRSPEYARPFSRAALALLHASRAWALIEAATRSSRRTCRPCSPAWPATVAAVHDGVRVSSVDKANGLISAVPMAREARPGAAIFRRPTISSSGCSDATRRNRRGVPQPAPCPTSCPASRLELRGCRDT